MIIIVLLDTLEYLRLNEPERFNELVRPAPNKKFKKLNDNLIYLAIYEENEPVLLS